MSIQASQTYLERYLDCVENLPDDLQRLMSLLKELDAKTQALLQTLRPRHQAYIESFDSDNVAKRRKLHQEVLRGVLLCREFGDEKLQLASQMQELVESHSRQLEDDLRALEHARMEENMPPLSTEQQRLMYSEGYDIGRPTKRPPRQKRSHPYTQLKEKDLGEDFRDTKEKDLGQKPAKKRFKKKTSRTKVRDDSPPPEAQIDPNEPTYCLCDQVSFGEMIGCDNDECPIEWFHFQCVGLMSKPKGKWYCPQCSTEREKKKGNKTAL
ncbi:inhibitor of growth protein 1-like [Corticium candelabrum]|uniref:inhibitor of growth protein 1-like n=1 Tax=Corticium candelabrum TaxID=121492 RepID=UPI002E25BF35|nr:inhibitor of growth protein 1-like [Corticium candelabrum]